MKGTVWFPASGEQGELDKPNFPMLFAMQLDHPNAGVLAQLRRDQDFDRRKICALLDALHVRPKLMAIALDHRDRALRVLTPDEKPDPFQRAVLRPSGRAILELFLDWHLHDARRLLEPLPPAT